MYKWLLCLLGLPVLAVAQTSITGRDAFWVLAFELTPDATGKVSKCVLLNGVHYGPKPQHHGLDEHSPPRSAIDASCKFFASLTLVVNRNAKGVIQSQVAPFPCDVPEDDPEQVRCHDPMQAHLDER
jgi:hypothetical protein